MKKIGLVGGTGPESTLMYYRELNRRIDMRTFGKEMPEICIESVNFREVWRYVENSDMNSLISCLSSKIKNLKNAGCEVISLTAATMHIVFDELQSETSVELISIPKALASEINRRGYKKVGLLGTAFTMNMDFIKKDLVEAEIEVYIPDLSERELIAKRIYEELENGIVNDSTLKEFQSIISRMRDDYGIEAVILGCTELPLLLNSKNSPLPVLDSVEIHLDKLINLVLEE